MYIRHIKLIEYTNENCKGECIKEGYIRSAPTVGQRFYVGFFSTPPVTEIIDDESFKTLLSTYKIEFV